MTSLLSAKKRAEEFAAAVEGGADRPELRPELAELVGVVGALRRESQPVPRAEFTASLRDRLMAEAATSLAQDNVLALPPRPKGSRERRIAIAASSLVLVGGTAGMAAAAQNALPGEALYPIKRGLEKAQTGLSTSDAARGQDLLAQADNRLVEVQGLLDESVGLSQVPATIDDFTSQAYEATEVILGEYEEHGDAALVAELREFAADNLDELRELAKTAPAEHHDELAIAAEALMEIDARAEALCPDCAAELKALEMPTTLLIANEARRAMDALDGAKVDNRHRIPAEDAAPAPRDAGGAEKAPAKGAGDDREPADGGSTSPGGSTATPPQTTPTLPGDLGVEGPSGGKDLGQEIDKLAKGALGGGGKGSTSGSKTSKDSKAEQLEQAIPNTIEDVIEVVVP